MFWDQLHLWQKIFLYALLLIALFVYVKASHIAIHGRPLLSAKYRILLAVFFPLLLVLAFFLGTLLVTLILVVIFILFILSLFGRRRIHFHLLRKR